MCDWKSPDSKAEAKQTSTSGRKQGCRCGCEPKRCAPIAAAVLAAVTVALVIRATRRSRRTGDNPPGGGKTAGCRA